MGLFSRIRDLLHRRQHVPNTATKVAMLEVDALEEMKVAISVINRNMYVLRGSGMWLYIDRSTYPAELQLCQRRFDEFEVVHS